MSSDEPKADDSVQESSDPVELSLARFAPHINTSFVLPFDDDTEIGLELVEVVALEDVPTLERPPFSLIFRGPESPCLEQGSFHMKHADLGPLFLFLVPVQSDGEGTDYEAVFT